jgi:6-hydroxy-3-succinoylpyridine 3-monooxygenase
VTNPTGGMGLTSGLFDSFVLSEALAAVVHGEAGDEVLDQYSEQRLKVFNEYASPTATRFKTMTYNATPEILDQVLPMMRVAAQDKAVGQQVMAVAQPVETPSLLGTAASG